MCSCTKIERDTNKESFLNDICKHSQLAIDLKDENTKLKKEIYILNNLLSYYKKLSELL